MQRRYKKKAIKQIVIGIDFLLLVSFLVQSLIVGCLIAYGYIPISANWVNQQLRKKEFDGFHIQADSFRLKLWHRIELIGLKVYHNETAAEPILKAANTEVQCSFKQSGSYQFNLAELIVTDGTLLMPAIYAPDGKRTNVLENVTFHLSPGEQSIRINSFVAKHEDIYLRGSIEWPTTPRKKPQKKASIEQFYKFIASALKEKPKVAPFIQPTLEFALSTRRENSIDVSLKLSCEQLQHPEITGSYFWIGTEFELNEGQLTPQAPLMLYAREIIFDDLEIFAKDIVAHVNAERWPDLFNGTLPEFEVSAYQIAASEVELNAPRITVEPSAFPILKISGTTCGLEGNAVFSGAFNSADKSGSINANGSIDISNLLPDSLIEKLPTLEFGLMPFYNLSIDFDPGFEISNANFHANFKDLTVDELQFDNITAEGYYRKGILNLKNIHIDRKKQWIDGTYYQNTKTKDFKISLIGSIIPKEYNALLPKWWSNIFKDINGDPENLGRADFAVQGNFQKADKIALFGHVKATNLAYKKASFDTCEFIVRSRQNYVEIHNIKATVGEDRATGSLGFTSARKPQRGLLSVRYRFDAALPIETISNALGGTLADILSSFELTESPQIQVDGVFFNEDFKEYADKNRIELQAKLDAPLKFTDMPLDYLTLRLISQDKDIYLRDVQFGYADGTGNAKIDIAPAEDETNEMCFILNLKDANQAKAIQNLPSTNNAENPQTPYPEKKEDPARVFGLIDLNLHAKGPLSDIYGFEGYGDMKVRNKELGSIQLLGPFSELLQNTIFNFTSFNLDHMDTIFELDHEQLIITDLAINGPLTRISANGNIQLPDQALDMDVKISLFANVGKSKSRINAIGRRIASPLPNLLSFKLTGTIDNQKIRSKFDPRNLIR